MGADGHGRLAGTAVTQDQRDASAVLNDTGMHDEALGESENVPERQRDEVSERRGWRAAEGGGLGSNDAANIVAVGEIELPAPPPDMEGSVGFVRCTRGRRRHTFAE